MKSCLLTIIVYLLAIQCINFFYYVCFNAFGPFSRELCCVAYRLAASAIVNKTPVKPEKALGNMAAPCVESSSVKKILNIPRRCACQIMVTSAVNYMFLCLGCGCSAASLLL